MARPVSLAESRRDEANCMLQHGHVTRIHAKGGEFREASASGHCHEENCLLENCSKRKWACPLGEEREDVVGIPDREDASFRRASKEDAPHKTSHVVVVPKSDAVGARRKRLRDGGAVDANRPPLESKLEQVSEIGHAIPHRDGTA